MDKLRREFNQIKDQILQLKESLKLKNEQIKTLKESLLFKKEEAKSLRNTTQYQEAQIEKLEELVKKREEQMNSMGKSSANEAQLEEILEKKNKIIEDLEAQADSLKQRLELKGETLIELKEESQTEIHDTNIIDYTDIEIKPSEIIEKMNDILSKAINSVTIAVPNITDLEHLSLYEVKSSIAVKISCFIDLRREEHADIYREIENEGNLSIRSYDGKDQYIIMRDNEELLFAVIGKQENNHLALYTKDTEHIKALTPMVMDTWLRSKKL